MLLSWDFFAFKGYVRFTEKNCSDSSGYIRYTNIAPRNAISGNKRILLEPKFVH